MLLPSRNETFHIILAGVSGKGFLAPGNGKGTGSRKCYGKGNLRFTSAKLGGHGHNGGGARVASGA